MAVFQFEIHKFTGTDAGTGADTNKNPTLLYTDEVNSEPSNSPIPVPNAGSTYSYECWLKMKCTSAPDNYVTNIKVWGPSTIPSTGLTLYGGITPSGSTPVSTASSYATDRMDTNHYQTGNALSWTTQEPGDVLDSINQYSDYLVLQLKVDSTAERGNMTTQVLNISYDES